MKNIYKMIGLGMILMLIATSAFGQASSTNYKLEVGTPVGGGGGSSSANYSVSGAFPISPGGVSGSTNYGVVGGVASVTGAGAALMVEINRPPISLAGMENIPIEVIYDSPDNTASGMLYYRQGGQTTYTMMAMTDNTGNLTVTVPAAQMTIRGLEYYTVVQSGDLTSNIGSMDEPYEIRVELTNAQGQRPSAMPNGSYRIIGMPIEHSASTIEQVFADDLGSPDETQWRLGRYETLDNATYEYPNLSMITPGKGYWLAARNNKRYGSAGTSVRAEEPYDGNMYYLVPLDLGWNMIANPYAYSIVWSDVIFDDNGTIIENHDVSILDDVLHQYNGSGYTPNSDLPAWGGAFVYIKKAGVTAMFLNKENSNILKLAPKVNSYGRDNWAVNLILETAHIVDDYNMAGVRPEAYDGADNYDFAEPPPAPDGASMAFKLEDDDLLRCTDFRSRFSEGAVWEIRLINCISGKIMAANLNQIPEGMSARIIVGNRAVRLEDQNEIAVYQSDNNAYLLIGTEKYLNHQESELLPTEFALEQNYPNPFNPQTSIRLALPKNGFTTLEIYNVLGQKVKTLINKDMPAGYHTVIWNGNDNNGKESASGIYFYRLISGDKSEYKKMLLIK